MLIVDLSTHINKTMIKQLRTLTKQYPTLDPTIANNYYYKGIVYEKMNRQQEAVSLYEKFLSNHPQDNKLITKAKDRIKILAGK